MFLLDKIACGSPLSQMHPGEKAFFAFLTLLLCLIFNTKLMSVLVLLLMAMVCLGKGQIPLGFYLKVLAVPTAFLMVGTLTIAVNLLVPPVELIWGWSWAGHLFGVTYQSLDLAIHLFLRSLGAASCLLFLALSTPFGQLIALLRQIKIPTLLLELMVFTYHFLSILWDTSSQIYTAQVSRMGYVSLTRSYHSLTLLIANLFGQAYRRALNLSTSLEARNYSGELHFYYRPRAVSKKNLCLILLTETILLLIAWLAGN